MAGFLLSCAALAADAESRPSLPAMRASSPPVIDGDLSEPCWQTAAKADGFTDEFHGTVPADLTEAWLCYDATNLYVAFHAYDTHPGQIVARETKEERPLSGEDTVTFTLDPFHTHQPTDQSSFTVNAAGAHTAEIGTGRGLKTEWKGAWQSAAKITTNGWTAEMAIPWAMLNYPRSKTQVVMGLNFSRAQQRTKVRSIWSYLESHRRLELAGHWKDVEPPTTFKPQFSFLPSGLVQAGQSSRATAGLDVRAALTPTLTGVFTANPDFSTVERAVEGIEFSYGERFVPDRRPFFLEGERFYSERVWIGSCFHSPRVPDFDTGLKLYGKASPKTSAGMLNAYDADGRNDFILRGRQELTQTDSMDVSLIGRDSSAAHNRVLVAKPELRHGGLTLVTHWAQSAANQRLAGDALNLDVNYRSKHFGLGEVYHLCQTRLSRRPGLHTLHRLRRTSRLRALRE